MKETKQSVDLMFRALLLKWFGPETEFTSRDVREMASKNKGELSEFNTTYRKVYCSGENSSMWGLNWDMFSFSDRTMRHLKRSIKKFGGRVTKTSYKTFRGHYVDTVNRYKFRLS